MAIDVEIQDEDGTCIARYDGPPLRHQFTALAPPDSTCFRFILQWADATFNEEQITVLKDEIRSAARECPPRTPRRTAGTFLIPGGCVRCAHVREVHWGLGLHRRPFAAQKLAPALDRSKEGLPSMLDYEEALKRVRAEIAKMPAPEEDSLVVYPEHTIERPFGWVFFWGSDMYAKTGEFRYALGGNAPFIVNRHSGTVVSTGTALPIDDYIRRYEADLA